MSVGASAESVPGEVRRVRMAGVRTHYREELAALEASTLAGLDLVTEQVDRIEAVRHQDIELAKWVIADDDRIDGRYLEVPQSILSLLALQSPVAGDLRLIAAVLSIQGPCRIQSPSAGIPSRPARRSGPSEWRSSSE